ncbi:hypothetical protein HYU16_04505 [Candidatus Woesearchaeota archaeon]|nr:hypothetical protein [Candidatus Woesearchaeota archaeon]
MNISGIHAKISGKKAVDYKPLAVAAVLIIGIIVVLMTGRLPVGEKEAANQQSAAKSPQDELQPFNSYISDSTGQRVEIYSGVISKVSESSITLERAGSSKEFPIPAESPPDYIVGKFGSESGDRITLSGLPKVGSNVTHLFWVASLSGEKQVTGVFINPD